MMPARKRTSQSKHTPPTSPTTSTSHATSDQQHHLRHTGPSISTRSRVSTVSSKPAPALMHPEPTSESPLVQTDPHKKKLESLPEVSSSGARTSFTKFLYVLLFVVLLLFGWYIYGMITLLDKLKEEVGWWGIVVGDSGVDTLKGRGFNSEADRSAGAGSGELEDSLNAFADALGISAVEVASAVKPLVPRESLTRITLKVEETGGSEALRALFEDTMRNDGKGSTGVVDERDGVAKEAGTI